MHTARTLERMDSAKFRLLVWQATAVY